MYDYKDPCVLDFSNVKYYFDIHAVISEALDFPSYYGRNWDALWDCMRDILGSPIHMQIKGLEILRQKDFDEEIQLLFDVFKDFKHYGNDKYADTILIEIIDSKTGKITVLE